MCIFVVHLLEQFLFHIQKCCDVCLYNKTLLRVKDMSETKKNTMNEKYILNLNKFIAKYNYIKNKT